MAKCRIPFKLILKRKFIHINIYINIDIYININFCNYIGKKNNFKVTCRKFNKNIFFYIKFNFIK